MTDFTYNQNIPDGPNNPSNDWSLMQTNTNSTFGIIGQDHIGFGQNNGGYHTLIHQVPQGTWNPAMGGSGAPANTPGFNQVCALNYTPAFSGATADTQLFNITGAGGVSQLTGLRGASEGWAWVGGLLLQWGSITGLSGSWPSDTPETLTFTSRTNCIPFPNQIFIVNTTFIGPKSSSTGDICINSKTPTNFIWEFTGSSSSSYDGFYWFAIGL